MFGIVDFREDEKKRRKWEGKTFWRLFSWGRRKRDDGTQVFSTQTHQNREKTQGGGLGNEAPRLTKMAICKSPSWIFFSSSCYFFFSFFFFFVHLHIHNFFAKKNVLHFGLHIHKIVNLYQILFPSSYFSFQPNK